MAIELFDCQSSHMALIVQKFGGTSVADIERIRKGDYVDETVVQSEN